jgi:hypothetical protein
MSKAICPGCGNSLGRSGELATILEPSGEFVLASVCASCKERAVSLVAVAPSQALRQVLAPFAAHLQKLAKGYEAFGTDGRQVGLLQAADILLAGKVPADSDAGPSERADVVAGPDKPIRVVLPKTLPAILETPSKRVSPTNGAGPHLSKCARAILTVLAQHGKEMSRRRIAVASGYSETSGGFGSALALLRAESLVCNYGSGHVGITDRGLQLLGPFEELPSGSALLEHWCERVGPCGTAVLQCLAAEYPKPVDRETLADVTGYSVTSGGFGSALAELRALGLVDGLKASDELMEAVNR